MMMTYVLPGLVLLGFAGIIWFGIIVPAWKNADEVPVVRVVKDEDENE